MNDYFRAVFLPHWSATVIEGLARTDPEFDAYFDAWNRPLDLLIYFNSRGDYTTAIKTLLDRGADANNVNSSRECVLEFCKRPEDVALLATYGAEPDLVRQPTAYYGVNQAYWEAGGTMVRHDKHWELRRAVQVIVLAHPRLCEDLARLVVELTQ